MHAVGQIAGGVCSGLPGIAQTAVCYNRDCYSDTHAMRQNQIYQEKNYMIAWLAVARDDVRDILQTSINKMNLFMVVKTLILGAAIAMLVGEGDRGAWSAMMGGFILNMSAVSLASASIHFLSGIFLSYKGSNLAFKASLDLLTLGLIPDPPDSYDWNYLEQLNQFEKNPREVLRVPIVVPALKRFRQMYRDGSIEQLQEKELLAPAEMPDLEHGCLHRAKAGTTKGTTKVEEGKVVASAAGAEPFFKHFAEYRKIWYPYEEQSRELLSRGIVSFCAGCSYFCLGKFSYPVGDGRNPWLGFILFFVFAPPAFFMFITQVSNNTEKMTMRNEKNNTDFRAGKDTGNDFDHQLSMLLAFSKIFGCASLLAWHGRAPAPLVWILVILTLLCNVVVSSAQLYLAARRYSIGLRDTERFIVPSDQDRVGISCPPEQQDFTSAGSDSPASKESSRLKRSASTVRMRMTPLPDISEAPGGADESLVKKAEENVEYAFRVSMSCMLVCSFTMVVAWSGLLVEAVAYGWRFAEHAPGL